MLAGALASSDLVVKEIGSAKAGMRSAFLREVFFSGAGRGVDFGRGGGSERGRFSWGWRERVSGARGVSGGWGVNGDGEVYLFLWRYDILH